VTLSEGPSGATRLAAEEIPPALSLLTGIISGGVWAAGVGEGGASCGGDGGTGCEVLGGVGVTGGIAGDAFKYFVICFWVLTREAGAF
jgi:hypothetical protein